MNTLNQDQWDQFKKNIEEGQEHPEKYVVELLYKDGNYEVKIEL